MSVATSLARMCTGFLYFLMSVSSEVMMIAEAPSETGEQSRSFRGSATLLLFITCSIVTDF